MARINVLTALRLSLIAMTWLVIGAAPLMASEAKVTLVPARIEVEPGSTMPFLAVAPGKGKQLRWSATGGRVLGFGPLGLYTAGQVRGIYQVTARLGVNGPAGTAQVKIGYAPVATPLSVTTPVGQAVAVPLGGTDRDNDPLTVSVLTNPGNGTLSGMAPNLTYTPQAGFSGTDRFTFTVSDGWLPAFPAFCTITVRGSGVTAPQITSVLTATGTVGQPFAYTITASNSPTSFGATGLPSGLAVVGATGNISGTPGSAGTNSVSLSATNAAGPGAATLTLTVSQGIPIVTWTAPDAITYGTPLSAAQLSATASVPGAFTYAPVAGTVLDAGTQTLTATFMPTDAVNYRSASASVALIVEPATPVITWAAPVAITYGTPLSAAQLNATASVPGTFTYNPAIGTVLTTGAQTLTATFMPTDAVNYRSASASVALSVLQATPVITWAAPVAITYGTPLSAAQLGATASVPGTFTYTPAAGTLVPAGAHTLTAQFVSIDSVNYTITSASATLVVNQATPLLTWANPTAIDQGTALSETQLNATASVPGAFSYTPAAGTVLPTGSQVLTATFSPTDASNYTTATVQATVVVINHPPTIASAASRVSTSPSGTTVTLAVLGADDTGEPALTYTWSTVGTPLAPVSFSPNGTNVAKSTQVLFTSPGSYPFRCTVADADGLTTTSEVTVVLDAVTASVAVTPASVALTSNGTRTFSAQARDQFGGVVSPQPTVVWSLAAGSLGEISATGVYTAPATGSGPATVRATQDPITGTATVTVTGNADPTIASAAAATPNPVTGTTAVLSVLGADDGGEAALTYTWATTGTPPGTVSFSANGTNAAKSVTATFSTIGDYLIRCTIRDGGGRTVTSDVLVTGPTTVAFASATSQALEETGTVTILVRLSRPAIAPVNVAYAVTGGTASASDYTLPSGTLAFAIGQQERSITVDLTAGDGVEADETIVVGLSTPTGCTLGAIVSHSMAISDPTVPLVAFTTAGQATAEGQWLISIEVTLTAPSAQAIIVPILTTGDATVTPVDGEGRLFDASTPPYVTIEPGATSAVFDVAIVDDEIYEQTEGLTLHIGNPSNARIGLLAEHVLTISDNDPAPAAGFETGIYRANEDGIAVSIAVILDRLSSSSTTVTVTRTGGTAATGDVEVPATVVVPAGSRSASLAITPVDDTTMEPDETVIMTVSASSGTVAANGTLTFTIAASDTPTVAFSASTSTVVETVGTASVPLVLSAAAPYPTQVTVIREGQRMKVIEIAIPAGATTAQVTFPIVDDALANGTRSIGVRLYGAVGLTLGPVDRHTLLVTDDEPNLTAPIFSPAPGTLIDGGTVTIAAPPAGAVCWYTTDGSEPLPNAGTSQQATGPITVTASVTLRAQLHQTHGGQEFSSPIGEGRYVVESGDSYQPSPFLQADGLSPTSPVCFEGLGSTVGTTFRGTVNVDGAELAQLPIDILDDRHYRAEVPLLPERAVEASCAVVGSIGGTTVTKSFTWKSTDVRAQDDATIVVRLGDSLLLTVAPTADDVGSLVEFSSSAAGQGTIHGAIGDRLPMRFSSAGIHTMTASIAGETVGIIEVVVVASPLPPTEKVACEIDYARVYKVAVPSAAMAHLHFVAVDPALLEVETSTGAYEVAGLTLKPLQKGRPVLAVRAGGPTGPLVGWKEVDEFELTVPPQVIHQDEDESTQVVPVFVQDPLIAGLRQVALTNPISLSATQSSYNAPRPELVQRMSNGEDIRVTKTDSLEGSLYRLGIAFDANEEDPLKVGPDTDGDGVKDYAFSAAVSLNLRPYNDDIATKISRSNPRVYVGGGDNVHPRSYGGGVTYLDDQGKKLLSETGPTYSLPVAIPFWAPAHSNGNQSWYMPVSIDVKFDTRLIDTVTAEMLCTAWYISCDAVTLKSGTWIRHSDWSSEMWGHGHDYGPFFLPSNSPAGAIGSINIISEITANGNDVTLQDVYEEAFKPSPYVGFFLHENAQIRLINSAVVLSAGVLPGASTNVSIQPGNNQLLQVDPFPRVYGDRFMRVSVTGTGESRGEFTRGISISSQSSFLTSGAQVGESLTVERQPVSVEVLIENDPLRSVFAVGHPSAVVKLPDYLVDGGSAPYGWPIGPDAPFYQDGKWDGLSWGSGSEDIDSWSSGSWWNVGNYFDRPVHAGGSSLSLYPVFLRDGQLLLTISGGLQGVTKHDLSKITPGKGAPDGLSPQAPVMPAFGTANAYSGNLNLTFPIRRFQTPDAGPDLLLSYNSTDGIDVGFGPGWRTNYDLQVIDGWFIDETGTRRKLDATTASQLIVATNPEGKATGLFKDGETLGLNRGDNRRLFFDKDGNLKRIAVLSGETFRIERSPAGLITKVTDVLHSTRILDYPMLFPGRTVGTMVAALPAGSIAGAWTFVDRDTDGYLDTATISNGGGAAFAMQPSVNSQTFTFTYQDGHPNEAKRLDSVAWGDGLVCDLAYAGTASNRTATVTDVFGGETAFTAMTVDRWTKVTDPVGLEHQRTIGAGSPVPSSIVEWTGTDTARTTTTTDARGNPIRRKVEFSATAVHETAWAWSNLGGGANVMVEEREIAVEGTAEAAGGRQDLVTTWEYGTTDRLCTRLLRTIDPTGAITSYDLDASGHIAKTTDPRNRAWTVTERTDEGLPTTMTHPTVGRTHATGYGAHGLPTSQTNWLGYETKVTWDFGLRVTEVESPGGRKQFTTFDPFGRVTTQTDELGRSTAMVYDRAGRLRKVAHGAGTADVGAPGTTPVEDDVITYEQMPADAICSSPSWLVTTKRDRLTISRQRYDLAGRLVAQIEARTLLPFSQPSTVTDQVTRYVYDVATGQLARVIDPRDGTTVLQRDRMGRIETVTSATGVTVQRVLNGLGWLLRQTDGDNQVTVLAYDRSGRLVHSTSPAGAVTQTWFDPAGTPILTQGPLGAPIRSVLDQDGEVVGTVDRFGTTNMTIMARDLAPATATVTTSRQAAAGAVLPDGATAALRSQFYGANGLPTQVVTTIGPPATSIAYTTAITTRADGSISGMRSPLVGASAPLPQVLQDGYGRGVEIRTPMVFGATTLATLTGTTAFRADGLPATETSLLGLVTTPTVTPATGEIDAVSSNRTAATANEIDWQVLERDAAGNVLRHGRRTGAEASAAAEPALVEVRTYDADNRMKTIQRPGQPLETRDYIGTRLLRVTRGTVVTTYGYDAHGQVATVSTTGRPTQRIDRDVLGRVVTETVGTGATAEVTRHTYDPLTLIETGILGPRQTTSPDERSVAFVHDDLGRRTHTIVNGARLTVVGYDALDRMVSRTPPGLAMESWIYYADTTTPSSHTASDGTVTSYTLSPVTAQVQSRTVTKPGHAPVVIAMMVDRPAGSPSDGLVVTTSTAAESRSQELDRAGRVAATEVAGERVVSTYDRADRPQSRGAESYGYDTAGRLHTITAPDGTATLGYDAEGLASSVTLPNGVSRSWTYDAGHRIAGLLQNVAGDTAIWSVGRDGHGRIATVSAPDHQSAYTYRDGRLERERRTGTEAAETLYVSDTSDNRIAKATYATQAGHNEIFFDLPAAVQPVTGGWSVGGGVLSVAATGSADLVLAAAPTEIGPELGVTLTIPIPASGEQAAGFQTTAADGTRYRILWQVGAKPSAEWSAPGRGRLLVERIPATGGAAVEVGASDWVDEDGTDRRLTVTHWPDSRLEAIATAGTQRVVYRFGAGEFGPLPRRDGWSLQVVGAGVTFDNLAWTYTTRREAHRFAVNLQDQLLTDSETIDGVTTSESTTSFLYDAKGNLDQQTRQIAGQADAVTTYAYDPLDRLITLRAGGTTQHYGYAADTWMRTSAQVVGGALTTWAFDGAHPIRRTVTDGGVTTVTNYLNRGGRPLWEVTGGAITVYGKDIQDNVIGLVQLITEPGDPMMGGVAYGRTFSYDAFGGMTERFRSAQMDGVQYPLVGAPTSGPRWGGMWRDGGADGLYKSQTRFYSPGIGRFTQSDPAKAGNNWYGYCGGDPVNRMDPSGLDYIEANPDGGIDWVVEGEGTRIPIGGPSSVNADVVQPDGRFGDVQGPWMHQLQAVARNTFLRDVNPAVRDQVIGAAFTNAWDFRGGSDADLAGAMAGPIGRANAAAGAMGFDEQMAGWLYGVELDYDVGELAEYAQRAHGLGYGGRSWLWGGDPGSWVANDKVWLDDDLGPRAAAEAYYGRLSGLTKANQGDWGAFSHARAAEASGDLAAAAAIRSGRRWAGETAGNLRDELGMGLVQAGIPLEAALAKLAGLGAARAAMLYRKFQVHHVISDKNAATMGHRLLKLAGGFNLESSINKIHLPVADWMHPTRSPHLGRHWRSVSDNLAARMDDIVAAGSAAGWGPTQYRAALEGFIVEERQLLRSGKRRLNIFGREGSE